MPTTPSRLWFFLGGRDLEMVTIRTLLDLAAPGRFTDSGLGWGAKASDYRGEIAAAVADGFTPVLVELTPDIPLDIPHVLVDHHGPHAADAPTALEQVFRLLARPAGEWSRWYELVAANDRGHVRAMQAVGATPDEMVRVRAADRAAQGISPAEEEQGQRAAGAARRTGSLTVVSLPHARTATVTDALAAELGGPGYDELLILCPHETAFFGSGGAIARLDREFPGGWSGGELPARGFWGHPSAIPPDTILPILAREPHVTPKPATAIDVTTYRQILFWPLLLKELPTPDGEGPQLEKWLAELARGGWGNPVPTLPPTVTPAQGGDITYEEMVYFHPFVRDFLYGDGSENWGYRPADHLPERPLYRLKRTDVTRLDIQCDGGGPTFHFTVDRLELYLCKPLVAVLVLDLVFDTKTYPDETPVKQRTPFNLADALTVQSYVREVYPPFFRGTTPGNCPHEVTLHATTAAGAIRRVKSDYGAGRNAFAKPTHAGAEPPVAAHWQYLLQPLKPFPGNVAHQRGHFYQQIEDDRMPGMTLVGVPDPRDIGEGDFDRLVWCNTPDAEGSFPYAADFLKEHRAKHCYERFWDPPPNTSSFDTRYLCSGYQFVLVGRDAPGSPLRDYLWDHFRRHYFRMGLILHYHHAALLKFRDDLVEALQEISGARPDKELSNPRFRDRVSHIQRTFLKFRTRSWFTEVTNQLQGRELFAWWSKLLGNDARFAQVDEASQRLYSALTEYETRQLTKLAGCVGLSGLVLALLAVVASFASQTNPLALNWEVVAILGLGLVVGVVAILNNFGLIRLNLGKPWGDR